MWISFKFHSRGRGFFFFVCAIPNTQYKTFDVLSSHSFPKMLLNVQPAGKDDVPRIFTDLFQRYLNLRVCSSYIHASAHMYTRTL